jgi:hypothetical protein
MLDGHFGGLIMVKQRYLLTLFGIFLANMLFAENIYKDFAFGMTINEVKSKCEQFKEMERNNVLEQYQALFCVVMEKMYNELRNPLGYRYLSWYNGTIGKEYPNIIVLDFAFDNGKLVLVQVFTSDEFVVLRELNNKYGNGRNCNFSFSLTYNLKAEYTTYLFGDINRYIVWYVHKFGDGTGYLPGFTNVMYINRNWIEGLCKETDDAIKMNEENKRNRARSQID